MPSRSPIVQGTCTAIKVLRAAGQPVCRSLPGPSEKCFPTQFTPSQAESRTRNNPDRPGLTVNTGTSPATANCLHPQCRDQLTGFQQTAQCTIGWARVNQAAVMPLRSSERESCHHDLQDSLTFGQRHLTRTEHQVHAHQARPYVDQRLFRA